MLKMSTRQPSRRQRQAEQTRLEILEAARALFNERGYSSTTIADIAAAAGVAVQTIYSSVGSKGEVLSQLLEFARETAEIPELDRQRDIAEGPEDIMHIAARLHRQIMERAGDIIRLLAQAAPFEEEAATTWSRAMGNSRQGAGLAMERLHDLGGLAPWYTLDEAKDAAFVMTHVRLYMELQDLGWSHDRIESYRAAMLVREFVDPAVVKNQSRPDK